MGRENRPWPRGLRAEVGSESMEKSNWSSALRFTIKSWDIVGRSICEIKVGMDRISGLSARPNIQQKPDTEVYTGYLISDQISIQIQNIWPIIWVNTGFTASGRTLNLKTSRTPDIRSIPPWKYLYPCGYPLSPAKHVHSDENIRPLGPVIHRQDGIL